MWCFVHIFFDISYSDATYQLAADRFLRFSLTRVIYYIPIWYMFPLMDFTKFIDPQYWYLILNPLPSKYISIFLGPKKH